MDHSRSLSRGRGAKKLAIPPSHSHSQPHHYPNSGSASPSTPEPPVMQQAPKAPNTAPQRGGKGRQAAHSSTTPHRASSPTADQVMRVTARTDRPARSATVHSSFFAFETPSAGGESMAGAGPARKRSRTFEAPYDGAAADDDGHSKGGHSLRKRARIDYTQEMIEDDLGLPAQKNDSQLVRPALTPSARGRKRKGGHNESGEDSDDLASNPKRSRPDKSPASARSAPARRRNPSKKLSTDVSTYLDQPSDNEVQDTILVSVPTGPDATSEEESEQDSLRDAEPQPTSSVEYGTAPGLAQSPGPRVRPLQSAIEVVPVAGENGQANDGTQLSQNTSSKLHVPPGPGSLTQPFEPDNSRRATEEETRPGVIAPAFQHELGSSGSPQSELQTAGASPGRQNIARPRQDEASPQALETQPASEIQETALTSATLPESAGDHLTASLSQDSPVGLASSDGASVQDAKPAGPARLRALERIYSAETPFASRLNLTPYQDADSPLPGPYTEWVYPAQPRKQESAPARNPTPALPPPENKTTEVEWDGRHRLRTKDFFALYHKEKQRRQESGEPPISLIEFNNECARRYKSAHSQDASSGTASPATAESSASSTVVVEQPADAAVAVPIEEDGEGGEDREEREEAEQEEMDTPPDVPVSDSRLPTAAASPAPVEDAMGEEDGLEDAGDEEQDAEDATDDQGKTESPVEPVEVTRYPQKQYMFPKIRDANDFVEAFEGWQDFPSDRLYETVAAAVETLHAYQQEYNELKKLLDDEENAKRRQANDKTIVNWENRQKADEPTHWRRHFDDAVKGPPPFEIRGARAPKPFADDPVLEHQKEEDRIMAQAYGFKYNGHPTQVGRQNPEEQRWEVNENRLRKRTEKGAELAEENVVEGKRARKPRYVSDQSKDPSRAGTPTGPSVFGPNRRQRRKPAVTSAANGDDVDEFEQAQPAESFSESPRKGRAARSRVVTLTYDNDRTVPVAVTENNLTDDEEVEVNEKPKTSRRRGRGAPALPEPPASAPTGFGGELTKPRRVRGGRSVPAHQQAAGEIASSSFYSNASTSATQPESRPSTASSDGTAHTAETAESTYSLRDRRRRNFVFENDPELEPRPQRRGRGAAGSTAHGAAEPKKRGARRKEQAAQQTPTDRSPVPRQGSPPLLQRPAGSGSYHSFAAGPGMPATSNGSQPGSAQAPGPFVHTFNAAPAFPPGAPPPPPPPPAVKKPITKIKFTNTGASSHGPSRAPTPANGASSASSKSGGKGSRGNKSSASSDARAGNGASGNGDLDKPYAEMTKSEKMSWSMRRRWASGEMQGAVEKRRTTLANKKAEKAATTNSNSNQGASPADPKGHSQSTESGSAGPSAPATPASMHGQAGPGTGLLALPQGPPPMLLPPMQQPQGFLQQPPYPYGMTPRGQPGPML